MRYGKYFIIFSLCVILLSGCTPENPPEPPTPSEPSAQPSEAPSAPSSEVPEPPEEPSFFTFTEGNFPRLDGSTATIPLAQTLKTALLGAESDVVFTGTSEAWNNLYNGTADLLLVYEAPEENLTAEQWETLEFAPIGKDGLVFLVNALNSTDTLTTGQVQGIYTGEFTDWSEVGGGELPITAYQRNYFSGSQTLMEKLVMPGLTMARAPTTLVKDEMWTLVDAVSSYDNGGGAIGYNVFYYVSRMKSDPNIKILSVDGVEPTNETIRNGEYPFVNDFYAAIRASEPQGSPARILYDWLQGEEGQTLVEAAGYVTK